MKKSAWQWLISLIGKLNPMPVVIKPHQDQPKENQQKTIRRWWR